MWGRIKKKKFWLRFFDSITFMGSSLVSLSSNLVEVNGMMWNQCKSKTELGDMDDNYVAHGMCGTRRRPLAGDSHWNLGIDLIFDNLRVGNTNEQF